VNIQEYISSGIVEAFVLGLASEEEVLEIVSLRKQNPELDSAILEFEHKLEIQGKENGIMPPTSVKDSLFALLEDEFVDIPEEEVPVRSLSDHKIETPNTVEKSNPWRLVAAAAIIGFIATGSLSLILNSRYKSLSRDFAALQKENAQEKLRFNSLYADVFRMQDSKMKKISMPGIPGKEGNLATVYWDSETGDVFLFKNKLPDTEKGKQYQLWAIVDGVPVDAGMLDPSCETFCQLKNIQNPQAFAITLEKEGGSPVPTMEMMFVMGGI
jgi:anti-sigma-K factor RskA